MGGFSDLFKNLGNFLSGGDSPTPVDTPSAQLVPQTPQVVQPQMSNFSDMMNNLGNYLKNGIVNTQKFIQSPQQTQILPTFQSNPNDSTPVQVAKFVGNIPSNIVNSVVGQGVIDPALDVGKVIGTTISGQPLPQYNTLKSGPAKVGYQIAAKLNPTEDSNLGVKETPQETLANVAQTLLPMVNAQGGTTAAKVGADAVIAPTIKELAIQGAKQGAVIGGEYGGLSGLEQGRDAGLKDQLLNAVANMVLGIGGGAAIGAATPLAGRLVKNIIDAQNGTYGQTGGVTIPGDENAPQKTIGQMQEEAQKAQGLGALADLDKAIREKDTQGIKDSLHEILTAPSDSPLAQYKNAVLHYGEASNFVDPKDIPTAEALAQANMAGVENMKDADIDKLNKFYLDKIQQLSQETKPANPQAGFINLGQDIGGEKAPTNTLKEDFLKQPVPENTGDIGDKNVTLNGDGEPLPFGNEVPNDTKIANANAIPEDYNKNLGGAASTEAPPPPDAQQAGTAAMNPKDVAMQGRAARSAAMQQVNFRAGVLAQQERAVLGSDPVQNELYRQALEHPDALEFLANESKDPQAFTDLVQQHSNFTDYIYQETQNKNIPMNYVEDYYTHVLDLKTPEEKQAFDDFLAANAKNFQSPYTKERTFMTIDQLRDAGFNLKDQPAFQDTLQYARSMGTQIGASSLNQKINELRPGGAVPVQDTGSQIPYNYQGKLFLQSNVPGNQGTFMDPEIQQYMSYYNKSALADNPVIQAFDTANKVLKETKLAGGLFHALRESVNYTGTSLANGDAPDLLTGARMFIDPTYATDKFQQYVDDGTLDTASKMGIQLSNASAIGDENSNILDMINSKDPIKQATFQRLINYYILDTVSKLDPEQQTPEMGKQIQAMYSGVNNEVAGTNKTLSQVLRSVFLAPQFNIGKLVNVKEAIMGGNAPEANFARAALLGTVAATAVEYEIGNFIANHTIDTNLKSIITNGVLSPNINLPYNSPNGKGLQASLPGSDVSDLFRAFQDPNHAISSRGAALPSIINQLRTGTDYYGNPVTPGGVLESQLPIPVVQLLKTMQTNPKSQQVDANGKVIPGTGTPYQNLWTAILNTAGLRVHVNPNDPTQMAQSQYFNGITNTAKTLNPNDQKIFLGVIHPTNKDANGNMMVDKSVNLSPEKYQAFMDHPNVLQAEQTFQQSQPQHAPLWDHPINEIKAYLAYSLSQDSAIKAQVRLMFPQIPQMQAQQQQYGQYIAAQQQAQQTFQQGQPGQIKPGVPGQPTTPAQPFTLSPIQRLSPQDVQVVSAYTASPQGSPQRKQLLAQNPWLPTFWNDQAAYYAQNPQSSGTPQTPLNNYLSSMGIGPVASNSSAFGGSSGGVRSSGIGRMGYRTPQKRATLRMKMPRVKSSKATFRLAKSTPVKAPTIPGGRSFAFAKI